MKRTALLLAVALLTIAKANAQVKESSHENLLARTASAQLSKMGISAQPRLLARNDGYAVYGATEGGFVVMSDDKTDPQVLGYSTSAWKPDRQPCGFRWWLEAVGKSMSAGNDATAGTSRPWKASGGFIAVPNFLKTKWGQGTPYNDKCPYDGTTKAPTGCIATAMAQVMRYYEWPAQGQGMGMYTVGDNRTPVVEEVSSVYNWSGLPNVAYNANTKASIKNIVASLMYDCGIASKMNYAADGSGAYDWDQALALARNFQYDSLSLRRCERSLYSDDEWIDLIATEMEAKRPILFSGSSEASGGHAFVFCGMDSDGRVYVNWGWNGDYDGYYAINSIKPEYKGQTVEDFSEDQSMNIGIRPMDINGPQGEYVSKWAAYDLADATLSNNGRQLQVPYYYLYNVQYLPFSGTVGLLFHRTDANTDDVLVAIEEYDGEPLECYNGFTNMEYDRRGRMTYDPVTVSTTLLPAGQYQVTWTSKAVQESVARPIVSSDNGAPVPAFYLEKDANGRLTLSDQEFPSGISHITADGNASTVCFDIAGRQKAAQHRGLTIVRQGGTARKVIFRK